MECIFKEGDLVRIKDTKHLRQIWPNNSKKAIGKCFNITFKRISQEVLSKWLDNKASTCRITPNNEFGINFYITDLELINPEETHYEIY